MTAALTFVLLLSLAAIPLRTHACWTVILLNNLREELKHADLLTMACRYHMTHLGLSLPVVRNSSLTNLTIGSQQNATDDSGIPAEFLIQIEEILLTKVTVAICVFGVLGNFLTLLVLGQRRRAQCRTRSVRESSVAKTDILGLMCLSASDILFCVSILPYCVINLDEYTYETHKFSMYYMLYSGAVINLLILTSTWLTVTLTLNRYVNLCHPLQGRRYFGARCMAAFIAISIIFSISFNLPRFWFFKVENTMCVHPITGENFTIYSLAAGIVRVNVTAEAAYQWSYFIVGIALPLCLLAYCNCRIIRIMYHSMGMGIKSNRARTLMTKILICIVIFYLLLVSPAEFIKFLAKYVESKGNTNVYNLAVTIGNTCQAINFAFNFMPYLVLDTKFRSQVCHLCRAPKPVKQYGSLVSGRTTDETAFTDLGRTESHNRKQQNLRFSSRRTQFD